MLASRTSVDLVPPLHNLPEQSDDRADLERLKTTPPERDIRRIRVRFRLVTNGATLLAELLLALVGSAEVRAEPNGTPQRLNSSPAQVPPSRKRLMVPS